MKEQYHYSWSLLRERLMSLPNIIPNAYLELFLRVYIDGINKLII
jgi:hypothetical protein